jgi:hypothetical protein
MVIDPVMSSLSAAVISLRKPRKHPKAVITMPTTEIRQTTPKLASRPLSRLEGNAPEFEAIRRILKTTSKAIDQPITSVALIRSTNMTKITSWVEPGRCDENRYIEIDGGDAFYFLRFRSNGLYPNRVRCTDRRSGSLRRSSRVSWGGMDRRHRSPENLGYSMATENRAGCRAALIGENFAD